MLIIILFRCTVWNRAIDVKQTMQTQTNIHVNCKLYFWRIFLKYFFVDFVDAIFIFVALKDWDEGCNVSAAKKAKFLCNKKVAMNTSKAGLDARFYGFCTLSADLCFMRTKSALKLDNLAHSFNPSNIAASINIKKNIKRH